MFGELTRRRLKKPLTASALAAVLTRPAAARSVQRCRVRSRFHQPPTTVRQASFRITELDCAHEAAQLRDGLAERPGVDELTFDVVAGRMDVRFDPAIVSVTDLLQRIRELGMTGSAWRGDGRSEEDGVQAEQAAARRRQFRVAASAGCLAIAFLIDGIVGGSWLQALAAEAVANPPAAAILFYVAAIILGLWDVAPKAWRSLSTRRLDMNLLVCLAATGAVLFSAWLEAAAVSMLFGLSILLEQRSVARAQRTIASLLRLAPSRASIQQADGHWLETDAAQILVGDVVLTRAGERLPVDGVVIRGESTMDESPVTGEFAPVAKQAGDVVYAGALNHDGALEIRASRLAADSTVARIADLVRTTQASKAPWESWVERFARGYTPAVFAAAILTAAGPPLLLGLPFRPWFYNALVLLVIACPCALVIATPVSFVSALATAARRGVLLKGGEQLEACAAIQAIALDKTGTLTSGRPQVSHFEAQGRCRPSKRGGWPQRWPRQVVIPFLKRWPLTFVGPFRRKPWRSCTSIRGEACPRFRADNRYGWAGPRWPDPSGRMSPS